MGQALDRGQRRLVVDARIVDAELLVDLSYRGDHHLHGQIAGFVR